MTQTELPFEDDVEAVYHDGPRVHLRAFEHQYLAGIIALPLDSHPLPVAVEEVRYADFLRGGWVTLGGSTETSNIIAAPCCVSLFKKGEQLPDLPSAAPTAAPCDCLWLLVQLLEPGKPRTDAAYAAAAQTYFAFAAGMRGPEGVQLKQVGIFQLDEPT